MYEIFEQLLMSYGITAYRFCKETGISQSTISTWKKKNNLINPSIGQKIASYFNVSLEYLMTGKDSDAEEHYYLNEETREMAQKIFENKDLRILFSAAADATPDDLQFMYDIFMALKKKEHNTD